MSLCLWMGLCIFVSLYIAGFVHMFMSMCVDELVCIIVHDELCLCTSGLVHVCVQAWVCAHG